MMFFPKHVRGLPLTGLLLGAVVLGACSPTSPGGTDGGAGSDGDGGGGTTLQIGLSADVPDLVPSLDQGAAAMMLNTLLHRGLLAYDAEGQVVPALAESYEMVDPQTFTFTLREASFADGTPITSEDVRRSLEYLSDPDNGAKVYTGVQMIETIETPDERTVEIGLSSPNAALPEYLADTTAAILPAAAYEDDGTSWEGAGPFVVEDSTSGVGWTLVPNEEFYAAEDVQLGEIDITVYADGAARTNALLADDVDLIDFVPWEDIQRVEDADGYSVDATSGPFMYIHFNVEDGPLADADVRRAVALAVNRDNVAQAAFSGQAEPIAGPPVDPSSTYYDEELANGWATDVEQARQLLADAGYADGFEVTLLTSSQYAFHQDTALSVQADLAEIGIEATLDAPDWASRQEKALAGDYDMAIGGSAGVVNHPSFLANFVTGPAANNRSFGFDDPELDEDLAAALAAGSEEESIAGYATVQERILETVPFASLVGRSQAFGVSDRVQGFSNIPGFLTFSSGYTLATASIDNG